MAEKEGGRWGSELSLASKEITTQICIFLGVPLLREKNPIK